MEPTDTTESEIPRIPEGVHPIMLGVVGSRLYGTDHAGSDYDWKGVYQAPTRQVLGIRETPDSYNFNAPDFTLYELGRFVHLLLKSNPTVIELLNLPTYAVLTMQGQMLLNNRDLFLFSRTEVEDGKEKSYGVEAAYHGFAHGQRRDLKKGVIKEKAIVHLLRVLWQGEEILLTGKCTPRMTPEQIGRARFVAAQDHDDIVRSVEEALDRFDQISKDSILPKYPNLDAINDLLVEMRTTYAPDPLM